MVDVTNRLVDMAGGDPFDSVRRRSDEHRREHGCGLYDAGAPVMQLVASIARVVRPRRVLDLGCGLGYSTLWIAHGAGPDAHVVGIDADDDHVAEARRQAVGNRDGVAVEYRTGAVVDVLDDVDVGVDMIHDDAWFADEPDHFDRAVELLRPGGVLTMANWFLLVDAITGEPRNEWERFAGPGWAERTLHFADAIARRDDVDVNWVTSPPIAIVVKCST